MAKINKNSADYKQGFVDGLKPDMTKIRKTIAFKVGFYDGAFRKGSNPFKCIEKKAIYDIGYRKGSYEIGQFKKWSM